MTAQAALKGSGGNTHCLPLFLRINPQQIHFLKFILEGYDGLAVLSTIDRQQGLVVLKSPPRCQADLLGVLNDLAPKLTTCGQDIK